MVPQVVRACFLRTSKKTLRWGAVLLLSAGAVLSISSDLISFAQSGQDEPTPLHLNVPVLRDLKGVATDRFSIEMRADDYARISVRRKGIDVLVNISSPAGTYSWQYENPAGPESPMNSSILAAMPGTYTIEVKPIEKWVADGRYEICLVDLRPSRPEDQKRVEAERKIIEGRSKQLLDTNDSRRGARDLYQQAFVLWQELGDDIEQANTLHFIAQTFRGSGTDALEQCIDNYRQALERLGDADKQAIAYTVLDMASAYSDVDKFQDAITRYTQAFDLFGTLGNRRGQAAALYGRGLAYARWQKMDAALKDYEPALRIYTDPETRDRHEEARTLHAMGGAYDVLGDPRAQTYFQNALNGWRDTKDPGQEGNTYSSLAKLEMDRGDWQKAFDAYDRAFELYKLGEAASIREKPAIRRRRASSLYGIAYTYAALGDYPKAFELLKQSLELRQPGRKGSTYMLMCYFQALSGEPEKALETCAMAISEQQESGDPRIGETYTAMGAAYSMMGKYKEALELYDKALAIQTNEKTSRPEAEAITQGWRGESLVAVGEPQKALAAYERARYLWQDKEPNGVAMALIGMARVERVRNNLSTALDYVTQAIATIEPLRTNVTSEDLRTNYFSTKVDYYELYIDLSMRLAERNNDASLMAAGFEASERARARSLIETLAKARFEGGVRSDPQLADLVSNYRRLQEEIKKPKAQTNIAELRTKQAQIESQLRTNYPRYAALMFPEPLKPGEVQKLLDADTLLLEFSLGEERSYVWAVTSTELHAYKLPPRSEIQQTAKRLVAYLKACQRGAGEPSAQHLARITSVLNQYWPEATAFSRTLLGQIPQLSTKKRLVIVADGELQYLPFAALPAPNTTNADTALSSVLIRDHEIANLPSASVLSILRQTAGRKPPAKLLAVFADPVLERDDPRIKLARRRKLTNSATPPGNELAQALRDVSTFTELAQLPRLQASGREAREIVGLAGRSSSLEQIGFAANRKNATSNALGQYRIVHFATHGILNEVRPQLSGMVLSLYDEQGRYHADGYFPLNDIYAMDLPVELVVLSACRTGLGKQVRGEGLIGLARGFIHAGSERVLASVWKVDDDATEELMRRFYHGMLKGGMTPAAALSAAQWSMSKDSRWSSPYYWAGFILQGEPK